MALSVEETEELIDDLNEYANSSVKVLEQAVVLVSRTKDGENVIQFPLTRLRQIEDIKDLPLEDGGLEWDDNMKLYVEASDLLQDGGGLTTDDNGDIYVDFSLMPTDKFEDLLKTLTIPIYLDENLYQYVDCNNGDDTIEDGRGSEDMPWKTISACVDYCTTYYNVNNHYIEIRVLAGTYDEQLALGDFSKTTGYINIVSYPNAHEAIVTQSNVNTVNVTNGTWYLTGLRLEYHGNDEDTATASHNRGVCLIESGKVFLFGCQIYASYDGTRSYGSRSIHVLWASSASSLNLKPSDIQMSIEAHIGNASVLNVLWAATSATISLWSTDDDSAITNIKCWGESTRFASVTTNGLVSRDGTGTELTFSVPDGETFTGKRYLCRTSGAINIEDNTDDNSFFPGDEDGTVDEDTYCWYQ